MSENLANQGRASDTLQRPARARRLLACVAAAALGCLCLPPAPTFAGPSKGKRARRRDPKAALHMAIVLDDSGSMMRTDPRRLSITAAMIAAQLAGRGDRVALVPLNRTPTRLMRGGRGVGTLLRRLRAFPRRSAQTIYDRPLSRAHALLANSKPAGAKRLVLFLTDGEPSPGPGQDPTEMLQAQERYLRQLAANPGGQRFYPVLLGNLGQRWRGLCADAARKSGGKLFAVAQSGDKLIDAFAAIYASQLGSKVIVKELTDGKHTLAQVDDFVRYANVVIISRGGRFRAHLGGSPAPRKVWDNGRDRFGGAGGRPVYHYVEKLRPRGPAALSIELKGGGSYRALLIWDYDLELHFAKPTPDTGGAGYALSATLGRRSKMGAAITKQPFLRGVKVRTRICQPGAKPAAAAALPVADATGCKDGPELSLSCKGGKGGACSYRGVFTPPKPGRYVLLAVARRQRAGMQVFELVSREQHEIIVGGGARLSASGGKTPMSIDQDKDSGSGPWQSCQTWRVGLSKLRRPIRVRIDTSGLSLPDGVTLGVNGAPSASKGGGTLVLRPGDRKVQVCLKASKLLDEPGLKLTRGHVVLRAKNTVWFDKDGAAVKVPVQVEIKPRGFWNRYKRIALYVGIALLLLLLLIWLIRGFVAPHAFPEALKVNWGKTIDRLDRNEMPVSELSQTRKGFYRNAQLWIGGGRCFIESGWNARARFEATSSRAISVFPEEGCEVLRVNKFDTDKRDPVQDGALISLGDIYQVGDLFVRLKL